MEGSSTEASPGPAGDRPFRFDTPSYERLLQRIRDAGRAFVGFDRRGSGVVLQHDVALSLDRALTMARLEATLRITGTYCVPLSSPVHDASTVELARTVRTISRLGHDVGLRFDPERHWASPPDDATIRERVDQRRDVLSRLVGEPVTVVSFGHSRDPYRSLDLDGAINAARRPADVPGHRVVTDREWRERTPFADGIPERFRLRVHPGLWHPVVRSEADVLTDYRQGAREQVDAYFDAFTTSPSAD
jgi:hypothetical protein